MATIGGDWIPHRRASDGELVGWIRLGGDAGPPPAALCPLTEEDRAAPWR